MRLSRFSKSLPFTIFLLAMSTASYAQQGKLKVHVVPKQAYVFVDGNAIGDGSRAVELAPGEHSVTVANYGYKMFTDKVTITANKTTALDATLTTSGGPVRGPWGRIQLEGHPRAAVLLNGKTPDYFVGHVDEFDNDILWKQELLVPPGTYPVTVTRNGNVIWGGPVTVKADERVIIDLNKNGAQRTTPWPRGTKKFGDREIPRFTVGIASATVAVAKPTGSISASKSHLEYGESTTLNWNSTDTVEANISGIGSVPTSGTREVTPLATTTYDFSATGPGGTVTGATTIDVAPKPVPPTMSCSAAQPSVLPGARDAITATVQDQSGTTLNYTWRTTGGSIVGTGSSVELDTTGLAPGTYTVTGRVENGKGLAADCNVEVNVQAPPPPKPQASKIDQCLFKGNSTRVDNVCKRVLDNVALRLQSETGAHVVVIGYASAGKTARAQRLAERRAADRAENAKKYLVSKGISEDRIETRTGTPEAGAAVQDSNRIDIIWVPEGATY